MSTDQQNYNEYEPPLILKPYLDCYWSYTAGTSSALLHAKPIIPDGCIDIIFDLARLTSGCALIIGAMTKPIFNNKTDIIGIRFKPGMAYPFIKMPMNKLTDIIADYYEFAGHEATILSDQLSESESIKEQLSILNKHFILKLSSMSLIDPQMQQALYLINKTNGSDTVNDISEKIGWSRQYFNKKCLWYTGLSPKFLLQAIRIKKVVNRYNSEPFHSWSDLSLAGGFYDQSHLINDFKKITGLTPIEFLT